MSNSTILKRLEALEAKFEAIQQRNKTVLAIIRQDSCGKWRVLGKNGVSYETCEEAVTAASAKVSVIWDRTFYITRLMTQPRTKNKDTN